jgi:hypothetical protein
MFLERDKNSRNLVNNSLCLTNIKTSLEKTLTYTMGGTASAQGINHGFLAVLCSIAAQGNLAMESFRQ